MRTGLLFATYKEAVPFLKETPFTLLREKPFPVYGKEETYLSISGIGKVSSAVAASFLITEYGTGRMFNFGSSGALTGKFKIGDILHIGSSVEYDGRRCTGPRHKTCNPDILDGFPTASLVTSDYPLISKEERAEASGFGELVDMEGAAFIQACRSYGTEAYLFKVVSDVPGDTDTRLIIDNIKATRDTLYQFVSEKLNHLVKI